MPDTANQTLVSLTTSHQIGLLRYGTSVAREVLSRVGSRDDKILDLIARRSAGGSSLTQLLASLRSLNREAYQDVQSYLTTELRSLAASETTWQTDAIQRAAGVDLDLSAPTTGQLRVVVTGTPFEGGLLGEWVAGMEQGRFDRLRAAIRSGAAVGESAETTIQRIRGTAGRGRRDGLLEVSRRSAETITRTAVGHVATGAREALAQANSDLFLGLLWLSSLDSRTSAVCRARDGRVFPLDSGPRTPGHLGCRSTMAPLLKSWRALGLRSSDLSDVVREALSGEVPASSTYAAWLAGRPTAEQDEILGATKGRLFRSGGLRLDRFVDNSGREYNLEQLRARDAEAFARAGVE